MNSIESLKYWFDKWDLHILIGNHEWIDISNHAMFYAFKCNKCSAMLRFSIGCGNTVRTSLGTSRVQKPTDMFLENISFDYISCEDQVMINALE